MMPAPIMRTLAGALRRDAGNLTTALDTHPSDVHYAARVLVDLAELVAELLDAASNTGDVHESEPAR